MGILDKAMHKAERLIGEAKEKLGQLSGNEKLRTAGERDQLAGKGKETAHDLRDEAGRAGDDAHTKLSDDNR
ncbi:MAG: CsbD family protein [Actinomycetota bacterium]|nr:CsbD family protein [Actinomycetota bacterium]